MQRGLVTFRLPTFVLVGSVLALGSGAAQTPGVRYINPPTMMKPFGTYTHVVEVSGPGRTIYMSGQLGIDRAGKQGADFREQATLTYENLKAAIEGVGGKMDNIVKLNAYLTDMKTQLPVYREVFVKYINVAEPPAQTVVEVAKLAGDSQLLEVEAVAVLPAH